MAINIKELFDADAENIKVDKINYNFDQVLANGGGATGLKGNPGIVGPVGQKGTGGDKGSKGEVGPKGDAGASSSLWDSDVIGINGYDVRILRPYDVDPEPNTDPNNIPEGRRSRLILGQNTYADPLEPNTLTGTPNGLLNLINPPVINNDVTAQIIFANNESGNPKEFKMATSYTSGNNNGTTFTLSALAAALGEKTNLLISIPNDIKLQSNYIELDGDNSKIKNSNNLIIDSGAQTEVLTETFNLQASDSVTLSAASDLTLNSSDRIDITATSVLESSANNTTQYSLLNSSQQGGEHLIVAEEHLLIRIAGTNSNNTHNKLHIESDLTTSGNNVLFQGIAINGDINSLNQEGKVANSSAFDTGYGIRFKDGLDVDESIISNGQAATRLYTEKSQSTNLQEKTLSDYYSDFALEDALRLNISNPTSVPAINANPQYTTGMESFYKLRSASGSSNGFEMEKTTVSKIGSTVFVNTSLKIRTHPIWATYGLSGNLAKNQMCFRFNPLKFPYRNDGGSVVTFPINIGTQFNMQFGTVSSSGERTQGGYSYDYFNGRDIENGYLPATIGSYNIFGRIYNNSNVVYLFKTVKRDFAGETAAFQVPLVPADFVRQWDATNSPGPSQSISMEFSFNMLSKFNSYTSISSSSNRNQINSIYAAPSFNENIQVRSAHTGDINLPSATNDGFDKMSTWAAGNQQSYFRTNAANSYTSGNYTVPENHGMSFIWVNVPPHCNLNIDTLDSQTPPWPIAPSASNAITFDNAVCYDDTQDNTWNSDNRTRLWYRYKIVAKTNTVQNKRDFTVTFTASGYNNKNITLSQGT